ncbi:hypothetical protein [Paenibacillus sp. SI8]|uniref:hypothetical protein n=1 Tax=unclassified Paenibacillus TaxID=185978 RepID=UPI003465F97B
MVWHDVLDKDHLSVKLDDQDQTALLEINDGGISPNYVTIRLDEAGIDELIGALQFIRKAIRK